MQGSCFRGSLKALLCIGLCLSLTSAWAGNDAVSIPAATAYWTLDSADVDGTTVVEAGGRFDGTVVGSLSNVDGQVAEGLDFPNTNLDFVDLGNVLNPGTESFSVSFWASIDELNLGFMIGAENIEGNAQSRAGWSIFFEGDTLSFRAHQIDATDDDIVEQRLEDALTPLIGQWAHFAMVIDRSNNTITGYLNGSDAGFFHSRDATSFIPGSSIEALEPLLMGKTNTNGNGAFNGALDDVAVWAGTALSAQEVAAIAGGTAITAPVPVPEIPQATAHWTLDTVDTTGGVVVDSAGGFDGTVVGSLTNVEGQLAEGLDFPNTNNDYVDFGHVLNPGTDSYTVSLWANIDQLNLGFMFGAENIEGNPQSRAGYSVFFEGDTLSFRVQQIDATEGDIVEQRLQNALTPLLGQWVHLAMVIDRSDDTLTGYLNGSSEGFFHSRDATSFIPGSSIEALEPLLMGKTNTNGNGAYDGALDDVRVWIGTALGAEQIAEIAATPPAPSLAIPDPTAHWTLDAADVNGGTVVDSAGGFDGTVAGRLASVVGLMGESLDFPATNTDFVDFGQVLNPGTDSYTVSLWANIDNLGLGFMFGAENIEGNPQSRAGYSIFFEGDTLSFRVQQINATDDDIVEQRIEDALTPLLGQWVHLAMVINRSDDTLTAYVNGSSEGFFHSRSATSFIPGSSIEALEPLLLGKTNTNAGGAYDGRLDDVKVWTGTALTAAQIAEIVANAPPPPPNPDIPMPTAYWTLDDVNGTVVDSVGDFDGTVVGTLASVPGRSGEALDFPNTNNDFVDFGNVLNPGTESYTVSLWAKIDQLNLGFMFGAENIEGNEQSRAGWSIFFEGDTLSIRAHQIDATEGDIVEHRLVGALTPQIGRWAHIAMVIDRSDDSLTGYLNGSSEGFFHSRDATTFISGSSVEALEPLLMGKTNTNAGGAYDGALDDVAVWAGTALSAQQIAAIAVGATVPRPVPEPTAHWTLDDVDGTVVDSVGNFDGNVVGTLENVPGQFNGALDFPNTNNDFVDFGHVLNPGTEDYTVSLWAKIDQLNLGFMFGAENIEGNPQSRAGYSVFFEGDTLSLRVHQIDATEDDIVEQRIQGALTPLIGQWAHIAMVIDRSNDSLTGYLNGSNAGFFHSRSATTFIPGSSIEALEPLLMGKTNTNANGAYDGALDDVKVWLGTALTAGQIAEIAAEPPTGIQADPNFGAPTAYWTLDTSDIQGGTTVLESGGNFDGTVNGDGVTNPAGQIGEALGFPDGDDSFVNFGPVLNPGTESYTVSLWFNPDVVVGAPSFIMSKGNPGSEGPGWSIWVGEGNGDIHCRGQHLGGIEATRLGQTIGNQAEILGTWNHLAYVIDRDNNVIRGYLNGSNMDWNAGGGGGRTDIVTPGSYIGTPESLLMGRRSESGSPYGGLVDEVAIWQGTALTEANIVALAAGAPIADGVGSSHTVVSIPDATAYWTMDPSDVQDGTVFDSAGDLDGTMFSAMGDEAVGLAGGVKGGKGLKLPDLDTDYVDFGDILNPGTESFTVSLWARLTHGVEGAPSFIISKVNHDGSAPGWSIWVGEGNGRVHVRSAFCAESPGCNVRNDDGRVGQSIDNQADAMDEWRHIAMVIDRENDVIRGYLNGTNDGWVAGGGGPSTDIYPPGVDIDPEDGIDGVDASLLIGRRATGGAPFGGVVDDVAIWKGIALTAEQIMALATGAPVPTAVPLVPGGQIPGDTNQDGAAEATDALVLLEHVFLGRPSALPCVNGSISAAPNKELLDWNDDGQVDMSDALALIRHEFLGDRGHPLGSECVEILGCPEICTP